jgi:hypothetical protein
MPVRVFVSTENSTDDRARRFIDRLRDAGLQVNCSPLNPALGRDPRWQGWYASGCRAAIEEADACVAVVTAGYDGSTWMASEFDAAWRLYCDTGRPSLFVLKERNKPLPAGFREYEEASTVLPLGLDDAVAALLGAGEASASRTDHGGRIKHGRGD